MPKSEQPATARVREMPESEMARRVAELPPAKRALLVQRLQQEREKERAARAAQGHGEGDEGQGQPIRRRPRESETYPLSFAQQRLWFLHEFEPDSPEYNVPQAFRIAGDLDAELLQRALREVVRRHETLRTTFRSVEGVPAQVIAQVVDMEVPYADARARVADPAQAWDEALRLAAAHARRPFDLTLGPLMPARPFRPAAREHLPCTHVPPTP